MRGTAGVGAIVGKRLLAGFGEWEIGSDTRTLSGGTADRARAITMHFTASFEFGEQSIRRKYLNTRLSCPALPCTVSHLPQTVCSLPERDVQVAVVAEPVGQVGLFSQYGYH